MVRDSHEISGLVLQYLALAFLVLSSLINVMRFTVLGKNLNKVLSKFAADKNQVFEHVG